MQLLDGWSVSMSLLNVFFDNTPSDFVICPRHIISYTADDDIPLMVYRCMCDKVEFAQCVKLVDGIVERPHQCGADNK